MAIAAASAKPAPQFLAAYSSPLLAAPAAYAASPYATAIASQTYHGVSAPYVAAPYAAYSAPLLASSPYTASYLL